MSTVFAKRSLLFTASGASLLLASFFSGIVIARLLGSEGSGSVVFALWLASVIAPMIGGGMWAAVGRTLPDLRGRGDAIQAFAMSGWLSRRLLAYVIIAVLGFFAVVWISPGWVVRIAQSVTMGTESNGLVMLLLLPALVIAQVLSAFGNNYLRGEQEFDRLARRSGWSFVLQVIFVGLGAALWGIPGAIGGYILGQVPLALTTLGLIGRVGMIEPETVRRTIRYARFAGAAAVANSFVWSRIEIFFLDRYWGREEIAFFSIALMLSSMASQGPALLTGAFLPHFAEKSGSHDHAAMKTAFASGTSMIALLAMPACLGMAAIAPAVVPMLYGEEFRPAVPAAMIIAALSTVSVSTVIATHLVQALERSDFIFYTAILGAGLSIAGGFLLVPEFGLIGAAVSRSVVQVIMVAIGLWFVVARLGYPLPTRSLLSIFAASACCALAAWSVVVVLDAPFSVVAAIALAGVVYLICLRLFGAVDRENLERLTTIVRMFPKPLPGLGEAVLRFLGQRPKPSASVNVRMVP